LERTLLGGREAGAVGFRCGIWEEEIREAWLVTCEGEGPGLLGWGKLPG